MIKNLMTLSGLFTMGALAADAQQQNADQLLRQMSEKLAGARGFEFHATREIDAALLEGRDVPEKATVYVVVR